MAVKGKDWKKGYELSQKIETKKETSSNGNFDIIALFVVGIIVGLAIGGLIFYQASLGNCSGNPQFNRSYNASIPSSPINNDCYSGNTVQCCYACDHEGYEYIKGEDSTANYTGYCICRLANGTPEKMW
jgi:hypothetical protein